jgi:hypothetical protein
VEPTPSFLTSRGVGGSLGGSTHLAQRGGVNVIKQERVMSQHRIYTVGTLDNKIRLVRATSRHQALSHVASTTFVVRVASQDELVKNLTAGVEVESCIAPEQMQIESLA